MPRWTQLVSLLSVVGPVAVARADADVDRGRQLAQEASFEAALAAFDAAERGELARAELVASFEGRALVHQGLGDESARDRALDALVSLAPEHAMGREMPPALRDALERARARSEGPVAVAVRVTDRGGGRATLTATVEHDPGGLVRVLRIHHRSPGGAWTTASAATVEVTTPVEHWVEAVGPGSVVVATDASPAEPASWPAAEPPAVTPVAVAGPPPTYPPGATSPAPPGALTADDDDGGTSVAPWIVLGVVAVAAIAVVAVVLLVPGDDTRPSIPSTPFP